MRKLIKHLLLFFCMLGVSAQNFKYETIVDSIKTKGYYRIVLSPNLLGLLNDKQSDLRLYDTEGKESPYIRKQEEKSLSTVRFSPYKILKKKYHKNAISYLTFHNPERKRINNVSFIVKNTDVQRRARLSGSDDQQNWYVIKDDYLLHSMDSENETTELKILNFPLSDYEFFKLEINDRRNLPINILEVGFYDTEHLEGKTTEFKCPIITQKDSVKTSFVKIVLKDTMYVEKLKVQLSGVEYYSRQATVRVKKEYLNEKKKMIQYYDVVGSFNLNSNSNNEIPLKNVSTKEFYIEIENKDNPPLKIDEVTGSFLNKYVIAELTPSKEYHLSFGDDEVDYPEYDIIKFYDKITIEPLYIKHQKIKDLTQNENKTSIKKTSIFDSPYFIWITIALVGFILGVISFRMLKELGNQK